MQLPSFWDISAESFRAVVAGRPLTRPCMGVDRSAGPPDILRRDRLEPNFWCRRVHTIDGARSDAWRWLSQMYRGAGVYGLPALEHPSRRSARFLVDDLPPVQRRDRMGEALEVTEVEDGAMISWQSPGPIVVLDHAFDALHLVYRLDEASDDQTTIDVTISARSATLTSTVGRYLCRVIDTVLLAPQVRHLALCTAGTGPAGVDQATPTVHQALPFIAASPT